MRFDLLAYQNFLARNELNKNKTWTLYISPAHITYHASWLVKDLFRLHIQSPLLVFLPPCLRTRERYVTFKRLKIKQILTYSLSINMLKIRNYFPPVWRDIFKHKGTSSYHCSSTYFYIPKYSCTGSYQCTFTYFWMTVTNFFTSSPQSYTLLKHSSLLSTCTIHNRVQKMIQRRIMKRTCLHQ